jgi:recombinational DNA repair protein RecR
MSERERKLGLNEAMFRQVNERLEELNRTFADFTEQLQVVCECADIGCADLLDVPPADYERVRAEATFFIVAPGHEVVDVEDVVETHERYHVVQKRAGEPARVARATDPHD